MKTKQFLLAAMMMVSSMAHSFGQGVASGDSSGSPAYKRGDTYLENTLPPSPEATSVTKYAGIPMNQNYGMLTFDVPCYTLKGKELSIPISLQYATGGIKLDEVAGVAGLGWTLNAGGCVTRTVIGIPDEWSTHIGLYHHQMPTERQLDSLLAQSNGGEANLFLSRMAQSHYEASLDRYDYKVCGLSGSFLINDDGEVILLSGDGVQISYNRASDGSIASFLLVDGNGTRYTCAAVEVAHHKGSDIHQYISGEARRDEWEAKTAWHITSIKSRSGLETARFTYSQMSWTSKHQAEKIVYSVDSRNTNVSVPNLSKSFTNIERMHDIQVLESIIFRDEMVNFTYSTNTGKNKHSDSDWHSIANYPVMLRNISVHRIRDNHELLNIDVNTSREINDGRIILDGLQYTRDSQVIDTWDFDYYTSTKHVDRGDQDCFGYYNGSAFSGISDFEGDIFIVGSSSGSGNTGFQDINTGIPGLPGQDDSVIHIEHNHNYSINPFYIGANHSICRRGTPTPDASKYMSIKSMVHNGLRTDFTYESSAVRDTYVGIRIAGMALYDHNELVQVKRFTYAEPVATGYIDATFDLYSTISGKLKIIDESTQGVTDYEEMNNETVENDDNQDQDQDNNHSHTDNLPNSIHVNGGLPRGTYVSWHIEIHDSPVTDGISLQDTKVAYGIVTEHTYPDFNFSADTPASKTVSYYSTQHSYPSFYGTLNRFPEAYRMYYGGTDSVEGNQYAPLGFQAMNGVRNGYLVQGSALSSLLIRQEEYAVENNNNVLKSAISYTYDNYQIKNILSEYRVTQLLEGIYQGVIDVTKLYHYPVYVCSNTGSNPTQISNVNYYPDGRKDSTIVVMTYVPRGENLSLPVRVSEKSMTEGGKTRRLTYTYADGLDEQFAHVLAGEHYLATPVIQCYYIENAILAPNGLSGFKSQDTGINWSDNPNVSVSDSSIVSVMLRPFKSEKTEFSQVSANTWLPTSHIEYTNGNESWRENVLAYDSYGNVQEIREKGKPNTVILWSYKGRYPVAVIENATLNDVSGYLQLPHDGDEMFWLTDSLFELLELDSLSVGVVNSLNALREDLPETRVSVFTFDPGIGMTSMTDANGVKTTFEYDYAGRLAAVKDAEGNLVKDYEYHLLSTDDYHGMLSILSRVYRSEDGQTFAADKTWWNTLGLKVEDIAIAASGNGEDDLVTLFISDYLLHDDVRTYLPTPLYTVDGRFVPIGTAGGAACRLYGNTRPYSMKNYEQSNRKKVSGTVLPGHNPEHINTEAEDAAVHFPRYRWGKNNRVISSTYQDWEVVKTVSTDADGRVKTIFKDHNGKTLATSYGDDAPTYYIYDDKDQLRAVAGSGIAMSDTLNMWRYSYDYLGRLSSKGIPGCVRESYEYDGEDRVIAVHRNGVTREMEYDPFGRLVGTYLTDDNHTREIIEEHEYGRDLEVATVFAMLNEDGLVDGCVETMHEYDSKARPVRHVSTYPDGSVLTEEITYNFPGEVISDVFTFSRNGHTDTYTATSEYDIRGRLASGTSTLNGIGNAIVLASTQYHYDDFGRPSGSTTTSGSIVRSSADTYTIQGWMNNHSVTINGNTFFTETLGYDSGNHPSYTGLITSKQENFSSSLAVHIPETYTYDYAGRLTAAKKILKRNVTGKVYSYDPRGNMLKVSDVATRGADYQQYSYAGDRLMAMNDVAGNIPQESVAFAHDALGRMTYDGLSGMQMEYNFLDLPTKVAADTTILVNYSYLADGTKASSLKASGEGLVYRGPFTYRIASNGTMALESVACPEGRLTPEKALLYVTDHLGSVRAVVDGNTGAVLEASDYSEYGNRSGNIVAGGPITIIPEPDIAPTLPGRGPGTFPGFGGTTPAAVTYRDHYTGQEDQMPDFGIPYSDHGARHYSPVLRRWMTPDPLSEKYYGLSPYNYCDCNPVNAVDPDGKSTRYTKEFYFAIKHPLIARKVGKVKTGIECKNISTNAVRFAHKGNILQKNNSRDEGSQIGAFRHALWQAQITSEFGTVIATEVGNAHEENANQFDPHKNVFSTLADADMHADMHNNEIGRSLAKNGNDMRTNALNVLEHFHDSGLYMINQNQDGSYSISVQTISTEQYKQLIELFKHSNENGF